MRQRIPHTKRIVQLKRDLPPPFPLSLFPLRRGQRVRHGRMQRRDLGEGAGQEGLDPLGERRAGVQQRGDLVREGRAAQEMRGCDVEGEEGEAEAAG